MKQYLDLLQTIIDTGTRQKNRTGIDTFMIPGYMLKFDLREGFPAVTTKKLAFKSIVGELIGFLRGCDTAKEFRDLGCKVWDANSRAPAWLTNEFYIKNTNDTETFGESEGYLGRIYSKQYTDWACSDGSRLNQVQHLINEIKNNPTSRRLIVSAWRPDELNQMALPPCHYSYQVIIEQETKTMHLLWNQRSCDVFLGIPFNIASYATLLHILARITGYNVGTLTGFLADVHIYEDHLAQVKEQLSRTPHPLPQLMMNPLIIEGSLIEDIEPSDIALFNYQHDASIKAEMAV